MAPAQISAPPREDVTHEPDVPRQPSDQVLLEQFIARGDQAAFAALVQRHGKTVWNVCRRVLRQEQDIEDAFQAVFIVLARKAASIRKGEAVGSWLYGVAYRTAMRARRTASRREKHEKRAVRSAAIGAEPWADEAGRELQRLLDEEIERLGNKYRAPFVLCCLEGMSRAEAARELRVKEGTLSALLARARKLLEKRLARRGVVLSAALAAATLAASAPAAAAPPMLMHAAANGALATLTGAPATVSPGALALARGVIRSMAVGRLKTALTALLAISVLMLGATLVAFQLAGDREVFDPDIFMGPPRALGTAVDEQVLALAFSPDGSRLVTAGGRHILPGQLQIWDVAAAKSLVTVRGIPGVRSVAFAPDGKTFATGDFSGHVKLRDAVTGQERAAVKGHKVGVNSVAYSRDGTLLVSAGLDQTLKIWSVPALEERKVLRGHTDMIFSAAFFHQTPAVVSGGQDKSAIVWNADTAEPKFVLKGHTAGVEAVAVSADDKVVATASWDRTIKLWDAATGKEKAILDERDAIPYSVSFSPDGKLLASARSDGKIQIWDMKTQKPSGDIRKHAAAAWAVAFSRDGNLVASGSSDRTAKIWHIRDGKGEVKTVRTLATSSPLVKPIQALVHAPDGSFVAMAARNSPIQIRDATTGDVLRVLSGHTGDVNCLAISSDGRTLASGGADAVVKLWDPATGKGRKSLQNHAGAVNALAFTPDGSRIASGGQDKVIRIWDTASGQQLEVFQGHEGPVRALAFTPDGRSIISGSDDRTIKVWDVTRAKEPITLKGHAGPVRAIVLAGSESLISGSADGNIRLWDLSQGRWRFHLPGHAGGVAALALTPSGRLLVSCGQDKKLRVWDAATGELRATLQGHNAPVSALAIHPRGSHVLSGGEDTMLLRWQGAKQAIAVPPGPPAVGGGQPPPDQAAPQAIKAAAPGGVPAVARAPAAPPRTEYPREFYRRFGGSHQPLPPFNIFGPDADLFTHPEEKGLRVTLPAQRNGTDPVGMICTAPVNGDFEITAGYEILQAERPKSGSGVGFELFLMTPTPGQDALAMTRLVRAWGTNVLCCSHNFTRNGKRRYEGSRDTPANNRTGRLRIVRLGSDVTFLAAAGDSDQFQELHRCEYVPDRLSMVRVGAYTGQRHEPVDVRFTDLRIRAEDLGEDLLTQEVDEDASGWLLTLLILAGLAIVVVGLGFWFYRRRRGQGAEIALPQTTETASASFACSSCGKRLKARADLAGRKVKCPECGTAVSVPAAEMASSTHIMENKQRLP